MESRVQTQKWTQIHIIIIEINKKRINNLEQNIASIEGEIKTNQEQKYRIKNERKPEKIQGVCR